MSSANLLKYATAGAKKEMDAVDLDTALDSQIQKVKSELISYASQLDQSDKIPSGWLTQLIPSVDGLRETLADRFNKSLQPSEYLDAHLTFGAAIGRGEDGTSIPSVQLVWNIQKLREPGSQLSSARAVVENKHKEGKWAPVSPFLIKDSDMPSEGSLVDVARRSAIAHSHREAWRKYVQSQMTEGMATLNPTFINILARSGATIVPAFGIRAGIDRDVYYTIQYAGSAWVEGATRGNSYKASAWSTPSSKTSDGSVSTGDPILEGSVYIHATTDTQMKCLGIELSTGEHPWRRPT